MYIYIHTHTQTDRERETRNIYYWLAARREATRACRLCSAVAAWCSQNAICWSTSAMPPFSCTGAVTPRPRTSAHHTHCAPAAQHPRSPGWEPRRQRGGGRPFFRGCPSPRRRGDPGSAAAARSSPAFRGPGRLAVPGTAAGERAVSGRLRRWGAGANSRAAAARARHSVTSGVFELAGVALQAKQSRPRQRGGGAAASRCLHVSTRETHTRRDGVRMRVRAPARTRACRKAIRSDASPDAAIAGRSPAGVPPAPPAASIVRPIFALARCHSPWCHSHPQFVAHKKKIWTQTRGNYCRKLDELRRAWSAKPRSTLTC